MIKRSIHQEDIRILNIYIPNIVAPQYINQILTDQKGKTDNNTIISGTSIHHFQQRIGHPDKKSTGKWT